MKIKSAIVYKAELPSPEALEKHLKDGAFVEPATHQVRTSGFVPGAEHGPLYTHPPRRETEQEPVAWRDPVTDDIVSVAHRATWETDYGLGGKGRAATYIEPLYTAPPRREWRGLTMQEINALPEVGGRMWNMGSAVSVLRAIRAVEAALKERNT